MPDWPWVSGGTSRLYAGHYPLRRNVTFQTGLVRYINGSEQRWKERGTQQEFTLEYNDLLAADKALLDNFVMTIGAGEGLFNYDLFNGAFSTWSFPYLRLMDDSFAWTQNREGAWDGTIRFRQFGTAGGIGGGSTSYPYAGPDRTPTSGAITGFPFTRTENYLIDKSDTPLGLRTAFNWMNKSLTGFPSRPLVSWDIQFSALDNISIALIEQHFITQAGRVGLFSFTDPTDGKVYSRVRYDTDVLEIVYLGSNLNSIRYRMAEVYGPGWTA